jgi:hypothetical protein
VEHAVQLMVNLKSPLIHSLVTGLVLASVVAFGVTAGAQDAVSSGGEVVVDTTGAQGAIPINDDTGMAEQPAASAIPESIEGSAGRVAPAKKTLAQKTPAKKGAGLAAKVKNEGAQVYDKPDFDGQVLATLSTGDKVRVSKGVTGSYAKFRRVRVGAVLGYISTMDVEVEGGAVADEMAPPAKKKPRARADVKAPTKSAKKSKNAKNAKALAQAKAMKKRQGLPIYFSRYVGALVGVSEFKEGIAGADASTSFTIFGLKITGPDTVLSGPITDLNIALHYGAPSYYGPLSPKMTPTGFVLLADLDLLIPFVQNQNNMVYFGLGPLLVLSSFKVKSGSSVMDLTTLNLGASFVLGGAVRMDEVALRLEAKYFLEKQSYRALQASVQTWF